MSKKQGTKLSNSTRRVIVSFARLRVPVFQMPIGQTQAINFFQEMNLDRIPYNVYAFNEHWVAVLYCGRCIIELTFAIKLDPYTGCAVLIILYTGVRISLRTMFD